MEAGEKEMRKAFEEVTTRNVKAAIAHLNETRKMVQELTKKVDHLEKTIIEKDGVINSLRVQIAGIQQKLYSGGS
jgi:predicted RNase H-like nuclease (RuvC/YqgF family)